MEKLPKEPDSARLGRPSKKETNTKKTTQIMISGPITFQHIKSGSPSNGDLGAARVVAHDVDNEKVALAILKHIQSTSDRKLQPGEKQQFLEIIEEKLKIQETTDLEVFKRLLGFESSNCSSKFSFPDPPKQAIKRNPPAMPGLESVSQNATPQIALPTLPNKGGPIGLPNTATPPPPPPPPPPLVHPLPQVTGVNSGSSLIPATEEDSRRGILAAIRDFRYIRPQHPRERPPSVSPPVMSQVELKKLDDYLVKLRENLLKDASSDEEQEDF